jgi:predicted lactoylglutathione lyase
LPFYIQIFIEKINYLIYVENKVLSRQTVDEAWKCLLSETHFNSWDERLKEYYEFEKEAREILNLCSSSGRTRNDLLVDLSAKTGGAEQIETILTKSLYMLQNDGYLIFDNGRYTFCSPLLRDFWYSRFIQ